ncbi:MAG: putative fluoride ion transporter CrcB [Lysobacteraceae bacterium]|nr:MAG: putative fluoride ion transporter CrcB [Xanthomonadaceae bacterium]
MYHGPMNAMQLLMVAAGGAVGSVARYIVSVKLGLWSGTTVFPWATVLVNALGCLLIGVVFAAAMVRGWLSPELRLLLAVGLLGGFTTFSTFAMESLELARNGEWSLAIVNVVLQNVLGLLMAFLGYWLVAARAT